MFLKKTPTTPIREKFGLLSLHEIYVYAIQLFMYKVHHEKVPAIFSTFFVKNREIHNYATSSRNKFHVPLAKSYYTAKLVRITGVTTFNHFLVLLRRSAVAVMFPGARPFCRLTV